MLVGPDAPLALDPTWRASHVAHTKDFCKPVGGASSPFPHVDGPATVTNLLRAADGCYANLVRTFARRDGAAGASEREAAGEGAAAAAHVARPPSVLPLASSDFFVAHAPFNKMVRKLLARLCLQDELRAARGANDELRAARDKRDNAQPLASSAAGSSEAAARMQQGRGMSFSAEGLDPDAMPESSYSDRALERELLSRSAQAYGDKAADAADVQRQVPGTWDHPALNGSEHMGPLCFVRRRAPEAVWFEKCQACGAYGLNGGKHLEPSGLTSARHVEPFGLNGGEHLEPSGLIGARHVEPFGLNGGEHLEPCSLKSARHVEPFGFNGGEHLRPFGLKSARHVEPFGLNGGEHLRPSGLKSARHVEHMV
eukprot:365302-Chlamydomonas_euryale.AAC.3